MFVYFEKALQIVVYCIHYIVAVTNLVTYSNHAANVVYIAVIISLFVVFLEDNEEKIRQQHALGGSISKLCTHGLRLLL